MEIMSEEPRPEDWEVEEVDSVEEFVGTGDMGTANGSAMQL